MKKVAIVISVVLFAFVQVLNAALTLDLRTPNGGNSIQLAPGSSGMFTVDLWGVVTGSNAINTDDGVQLAYAWLTTTNNGLTGLTGFSATSSRAVGFISPDIAEPEGTLVSNGGIYDLMGSAKPVTWGVHSKAGASIPPYTGLNEPGLPSADVIAMPNGAEFKLGTFSYSYNNVGGTPGASAILNYVAPTWIDRLRMGANWAEDSTLITNKATTTTALGIGDGVTLTLVPGLSTSMDGEFPSMPVPEPSTLILLGTATVTLLIFARRQRKKF